MTQHVAAAVCALGTALVAVAYVSPFVGARVWGVWSMIAGIALCCAGAMALGMSRSGPRPRVLTAALLLVTLCIVCGFGFALALPEPAPSRSTILLGFPLRTALVVYVVGAIPLVLLPIAYALAFDNRSLSPEVLHELRAPGYAEDS